MKQFSPELQTMSILENLDEVLRLDQSEIRRKDGFRNYEIPSNLEITHPLLPFDNIDVEDDREYDWETEDDEMGEEIDSEFACMQFVPM